MGCFVERVDILASAHTLRAATEDSTKISACCHRSLVAHTDPPSTITPSTPTSTSTLDNDTVSESQLDRISETQSGLPLETRLNMSSNILPHTAEDLIQLATGSAGDLTS
jgi:hypothetical protein